jgi:ubiquinone/menaquinone biosynthesis C-methylase UbiE
VPAVFPTEGGAEVNLNLSRSIRESYDNIADEYALRIFNELEHKPLDRALLDRFVSEVKGRGEVCEMGCGPGHVARYLHDAGVNVFGLDLSPRMLQQARRLSRDIDFREGDMTALSLDDETLAGITAFYAIVNIPEQYLPTVFREMKRVMKPEGIMLLAFHTGDSVSREEELWGRRISMDFCLFPPQSICRLLVEAGFSIEEVIEREPYAPEVEYQSRRAYIFARKPHDSNQRVP